MSAILLGFHGGKDKYLKDNFAEVKTWQQIETVDFDADCRKEKSHIMWWNFDWTQPNVLFILDIKSNRRTWPDQNKLSYARTTNGRFFQSPFANVISIMQIRLI